MANYNLGIWFGNFNKLEEAAAHYQIAIDKAPDFLEARYNLGNIYARVAQFENATAQYTYILNINPGHKQSQNILNNMVLLKTASPSALLNSPNLMVGFTTKNGLQFSFPAFWSKGELRKAVSEKETKTGKTTPVSDEAVGTSLESPDGFKIQIIEDSLGKKNMEEYINGQKETHGKLVNQGLAQIPNAEGAFVKVWEGDGVTKLQFFLFIKKKVIQIIAYPAGLPSMPIFDAFLGSLKLHDT